jgi:hypothetical protein
MRKYFTGLSACILVYATLAFLSSCGKSADPINPKIGSTAISSVNSGIPTVSGTSSSSTSSNNGSSSNGSGSNNGVGSSSTGGTTSGGSSSNPGGTTSGSNGSNGGSSSGSSTSSGPLSPTGNNGIAIGPANTIIFKAGSINYKLAQSSNDMVGCAAIDPINFAGYTMPATTTLTGLNNAQTVSLILQINEQGTGAYTIDKMSLVTPSASYDIQYVSKKGVINFNTYSKDARGVVTGKGTFDAYLANTDPALMAIDSIRVSGSFNVQP